MKTDAPIVLHEEFTNSSSAASHEFVRQARKDPILMEEMRITLSRRAFLRDWAARHQVSCPEEFRRSYVKQWRRKHRVPGQSRKEEWLRANGLTEDAYDALVADRALIEWLIRQGASFFGLRESFILEWAAENGVTLPLEFLCRGATDQTLERWIIQQGPGYFGLRWNFDAALVEELQVTGKAAEMTRLEAA